MAKAKWDTETGYQMFLAGNSDTAIGRALGVAAGTVNFYKRKHWLSKEPTGGDTVNRAPVENGKEEPVMQPKAINPPVDTAMYETVEAATRELKGIQAICTADAIQSLWNWKSIYDLQRARASIDYLLKRLGEENAAR